MTTHSSQSDLSVIPYTPPSSSATTQLAQTLSWVLNDRENLGYSLMSTFGSFLQEVPKHLGHCPALDASVKVMVSGYSSFRLNNDNLNLVVAKEYAQALLQLRNDVASFSGQGLPLIIAAVTILALFEVSYVCRCPVTARLLTRYASDHRWLDQDRVDGSCWRCVSPNQEPLFQRTGIGIVQETSREHSRDFGT